MDYFNQVFASGVQTSYYRNMQKIFERSRDSQYRIQNRYLEEHYIVPRCWFRLQGLEIDNSQGNKVYLSCKDHLRVHVLLVYYFLELGDKVMYTKMLQALWLMSREGYSQVKTLGDISKDVYEAYERERFQYYEKYCSGGHYLQVEEQQLQGEDNKNRNKNKYLGLSGDFGVSQLEFKKLRKRKYTERQMRECFEVFRGYEDSSLGFLEVSQRFPWVGENFSKEKNFLQRMREYVGSKEFQEMRDRQREYSRVMKMSRRNKTS